MALKTLPKPNKPYLLYLGLPHGAQAPSIAKGDIELLIFLCLLPKWQGYRYASLLEKS